MEYSYIAIDKAGLRQKGVIEANSQKEILAFLRTSNLTTLSIKPITANKGLTISYLNKIKNGDFVIFTRQLSSMILTGLTLIEALNILKKQNNKPKMQIVLNDIIDRVSEGNALSQALENHKDIFSEVYIALIKAAEAGGLMDKVLERLADNLEKSEDLKKRVRSALFYPGIIMTGVILVIGIMNIFVIPQLGGLYENLNLELPLTTRIVLSMSKATRQFFPLIIVGMIAAVFLYRRLSKAEDGKKIIDKVKLKIPVFGKIIELGVLDEVTRTLSLLVSSGTSIIDALEITAKVANNYWYRRAVTESSTLVEKGISISNAFENQNIFPQIVIQMTKVGESTGKIDESLLKVSEYFERDLDLKVKTLTTAIEPILIITLGISVAFLIISVITPIYGLISQIQ